MKNYTIAVTTTETTQDISPCKYLQITVNAVDALVKLRKTPNARGNAEEGDFRTLEAGQTYYFRARKGAFWAIIHKTASSTSTLTVDAGTEEFFQNYPPIVKQQADVYFSQTNPVSTTLYEVLPTTANVQIESIADNVTWAVTQPTPLEVVVTIDGIPKVYVMANPITATNYSPMVCPALAADAQLQVPTRTDGLLTNMLGLRGRSVRVQVRITWAVTQPTPLVCRVKYAKW